MNRPRLETDLGAFARVGLYDQTLFSSNCSQVILDIEGDL